MTTDSYAAAYRQSLDDPDAFWRRAAEGIEWSTPPTTILDSSKAPLYRWFPGATLNTCFNALDRHVRDGRGEQPALIHDSPVSGTKTTITYARLLARVATFAGALASLGVGKGDRVVIYMPMVPEAVVAMLACARLGAIHSVVFGGFAPAELAARIDDAQPKVVVAASCGIEPSRVVQYKPMLDAALDRSTHKPESVIVFQREQARSAVGERDTDWEEMDW
ncbi:MAG: AMP-binding protein, partial [Knoellia sp.]